MKKKQPSELRQAQVGEIDDRDIDTSDIPDLSNTTGWVRGLMYRPVMQPISIRLAAPDIEMPRQLARKKGVPYQTYVERLLHKALKREVGSGRRGNTSTPWSRLTRVLGPGSTWTSEGRSPIGAHGPLIRQSRP
jgi:predicted DNA binding CopG/RHH family protein